MNLCFAYPNKFRFSETFIHDQLEQLQPKITIYEGWYPSLDKNDVSFLPFPFNILYIRGGLRNVFPGLYHKIYTYFLAKYLTKNKIDVVLAQYGPMGATINDACIKANAKMVVHFHGFDANDNATLEKYLPAYKRMFQTAKGIIAVSRDMRNKLIEFGADPEKVVFNSCFVNTNLFTLGKPENNEKIFMTVGRFTAKKSPLSTIKAFHQVLQTVPDAMLKMIGEGELWEASKALVKELEIEASVEFLGVKRPSEIIELLKTARVFVQHSMFAPNGDSEGTPVSILEASAVGLPIVSTYHAGIKDAVVHEKTGFLVNEGDWEEMAKYMTLLINNAELCGEMGRCARQHMEDYYEMSKRVNTLREILEK